MQRSKMNNKGFTLIDVLVVVAIVAVLATILIPKMGGSTTRAAAGTNAANLESVEAMVSIHMLNDDELYEDLVAAGKTIDNPENWILDAFFGRGTSDFLNKKLATVTAHNGTITLSDGTTFTGLPDATYMSIAGYTVAEGTPVSLYFSEDEIVAFYGKLSIVSFVDIAEDGIFDGGAHVCIDLTGGSNGLSNDGYCDICGSLMGTLGSNSSKPHTCRDNDYDESGYSGLIGWLLDMGLGIFFTKDGVCDEEGCGIIIPHDYVPYELLGKNFCKVCGNDKSFGCHQ